jgi:hypothetical protein
MRPFSDMDIAIVHYNTPELTGALLASIRKWMPTAHVTIFENSDDPRRKLPPMGSRVWYLDNTRGQVVDFDAILARHPQRSREHAQDASVKHMASVAALWDYLPDGFILLDSDVLLKRDLSELADPSVAWCAGVQYGMTFGSGRFRPRALPFVCWINVPMCRAAGVRYFDESRSWKLAPGMFYDTGASFYLDCRAAGLPSREIRWEDYAVHFKGGSWDAKDPAVFLRENRALYD